MLKTILNALLELLKTFLSPKAKQEKSIELKPVISPESEAKIPAVSKSVNIPDPKSIDKYKLSNLGKAEILLSEGLCLSKYKDSVGVWTIGLGATASEIPDLASWSLNKELSLEEAFELFNKGIIKYEIAVNKAIKVPLSQNQFDALVSITYNIGTGGMSKSTFIKRINAGKSLEEIKAAIMMWTKQKELVGRRTKEAELFATGKYHNTKYLTNLFPVINTKPAYSRGKMIKIEKYL